LGDGLWLFCPHYSRAKSEAFGRDGESPGVKVQIRGVRSSCFEGRPWNLKPWVLWVLHRKWYINTIRHWMLSNMLLRNGIWTTLSPLEYYNR
jgi:hypothetical protein